MKKEEYLNLLRNNKLYQIILSKASSDEEKRAIKAYTEDFMMKFYTNVFSPISTLKKNDPDALKKIYSDVDDEIISKHNKE